MGKYHGSSQDVEWTGSPYRYQGCYSDTAGAFLGRTLPQGLHGRTGVTVEECAREARSRGFPLFALQGKGQCAFGSVADVQMSQQKLDDGACNDVPCPAAAATCRGYVSKVYIMLGEQTPLTILSR